MHRSRGQDTTALGAAGADLPAQAGLLEGVKSRDMSSPLSRGPCPWVSLRFPSGIKFTQTATWAPLSPWSGAAKPHAERLVSPGEGRGSWWDYGGEEGGHRPGEGAAWHGREKPVTWMGIAVTEEVGR